MKPTWSNNDLSQKFKKKNYQNFQNVTQCVQLTHIKKKNNYFLWQFLHTFLKQFIPIINWLPHYKWRDSFFADLSAGLTMAVFSVPTGIAHAGVCGIAPVYGLYTAIFPNFFYLFFGNSRHNTLGGFAILSLMTRSVIEKVFRLTNKLSKSVYNNTAITITPPSVFLNTFSTTLQLNSSNVKKITKTIINATLLLNKSFNATTNKSSNFVTSSLPYVLQKEVASLENNSMIFKLASNSDNHPVNFVVEKNNPFFKDSLKLDNLNVDNSATNKPSDANIDKSNENLKFTEDYKKQDATAKIFVNSDLSKTVTNVVSQNTLNTFNNKINNYVVNKTLNFVNKSKVNDKLQNSIKKSKSNSNLYNTKPVHIATAIVFLSGILQILMGIFRLDFLSCYLSEQIMSGFVLGGCVHVFFSQIPDIIGISLPPRSGHTYLYNRFFDIISRIDEIHLPTTIISFCSIFFLLFSQKILEPRLSNVFCFPIPYELILVIVGITSTNFAQLSKRHSVKVVGNIPTAFPMPSLPHFDLFSLIFFDALSIAVTAVAIHLTVVKIVENRYHYRIGSCQELYSLGLSGLFSSVFPVFPTTSTFAKTLIGDADKNSTQMTIFFSTMGLFAVILYIGPVLEYLPKCILASMVVVSLSALSSKLEELKKLWPLFKFDFIIFIVSFLLTVCYDMAEGLTFTVIFAIFTIVVRDQWPKWHFLSHDEECNEFRETPKQQINENNSVACVLRYDAPLIFPNVDKFLNIVEQGVKQWEKRHFNQNNNLSNTLKCNYFAKKTINTRFHQQNFENNCSKKNIQEKVTWETRKTALIIDCSGFPYVDYLGLCTLKKLYAEFSNKKIIVKFAAPKAILMRMFQNTDFTETVPAENIFTTVRHAVNSISISS